MSAQPVPASVHTVTLDTSEVERALSALTALRRRADDAEPKARRERIRVERCLAHDATPERPTYAEGWIVLDPEPPTYLRGECFHDTWAVAMDCAYWRARLR